MRTSEGYVKQKDVARDSSDLRHEKHWSYAFEELKRFEMKFISQKE